MIEHTKSILRQIIPQMEGWLSVERALEMYDLIIALRPSVVVEIGVFGGRSVFAQAMALADQKHGKIYGIDPWKHAAALEGEDKNSENAKWWQGVDLNAIHQKCMNVLWQFGLDARVNIIRAASQDCHEIIPPIDVLYIDGNHSEVASTRDVSLYLPKMKQNGHIWIDDVDWTSTGKAVAMIEAECVCARNYGTYRLYVKKNYTPEGPPMHHPV